MSRESECGTKRRYLTRALAKKAARLLRNKGSGHLNTYECSWCGFHHVGHYREGLRERKVRIDPSWARFRKAMSPNK